MDPEPGSLALSELESMKVVDSAGDEVGELIDVVAGFSTEAPVVHAFFVARDDEQLAASWAQVAEIDVDEERLRLNCPASALGGASLRAGEIALVDAVLDKQVVDMRDRSFVRVQDVVLETREDRLVVTGVDASRAALARRCAGAALCLVAVGAGPAGDQRGRGLGPDPLPGPVATK